MCDQRRAVPAAYAAFACTSRPKLSERGQLYRFPQRMQGGSQRMSNMVAMPTASGRWRANMSNRERHGSNGEAHLLCRALQLVREACGRREEGQRKHGAGDTRTERASAYLRAMW